MFGNPFWQSICLLVIHFGNIKRNVYIEKKLTIIVDKRNTVALHFGDEEWKQIQSGAKWLYADGQIPKPTAYSFLKWCGLTFALTLKERHSGDFDDY